MKTYLLAALLVLGSPALADELCQLNGPAQSVQISVYRYPNANNEFGAELVSSMVRLGECDFDTFRPKKKETALSRPHVVLDESGDVYLLPFGKNALGPRVRISSVPTAALPAVGKSTGFDVTLDSSVSIEAKANKRFLPRITCRKDPVFKLPSCKVMRPYIATLTVHDGEQTIVRKGEISGWQKNP